MKRVAIIIVLGAFFVVSLSSAGFCAWGHGGGGWHGGYYGYRGYYGGWRWGWGYPYYFGYGPWWGYPYGYPYAPYAYPYSSYPYTYQPPVANGPMQSEPQQSYWYYCQDAQAYYPYVKSCPGGWTKVIPTPPQSGGEGPTP